MTVVSITNSSSCTVGGLRGRHRHPSRRSHTQANRPRSIPCILTVLCLNHRRKNQIIKNDNEEHVIKD